MLKLNPFKLSSNYLKRIQRDQQSLEICKKRSCLIDVHDSSEAYSYAVRAVKKLGKGCTSKNKVITELACVHVIKRPGL